MRNHSQVATLRPHTRDFPEGARETLGVVLIRAREAAGYMSRPAFSRHSGIGITSLVKIESGKPVGPQVYEKYARALDGWTEDAPVRVLRGEPAPQAAKPEVDTAEVPPVGYVPLAIRPAMFTDEWLDHYADILPEEDFLEVKLLMLAAERLQKRVTELERTLAERSIPQVNT